MKTDNFTLIISLFFPLCFFTNPLQAQTCVSSFPYEESFFLNNGGWVSSQNSIWSYAGYSSTYTGCIGFGGGCLATNSSYNYPDSVSADYIVSPCFDFSGFSFDPIFFFDYRYQTEDGPTPDDDYFRVEISTDSINWTTLGQQGKGLNWYNTTNGWAGTTPDGYNEQMTASIELAGMKGQSKAYLRFVFHSNFIYNFEGVSIDNIKIIDPSTNDVTLTSINNLQSKCNMGVESVEVMLHNTGGTDIINCPIRYRYSTNFGNYTNWLSAGSYTGTLESGDAANFSFNVDFSTKGHYNLEVEPQLSGDTTQNTQYALFYNYNPINSFPYEMDFSNVPHYWQIGGINSSWNTTSHSSNGVTTYYASTQLGNDYNVHQLSYMQSPCFDFTNVDYPVLEFSYEYRVPAGDGANLTCSTDGGATWKVIGDGNFPNNQNWYDTSNNTLLGGQPAWSNTIHSSASPSVTLDSLAGESSVIFRYNFASGIDSTDYFGFQFYQFSLYNAPPDVGVKRIEGLGNSGVRCYDPLNPTDSVEVTICSYGIYSVRDVPVEYMVDSSGVWLVADTLKGVFSSYSNKKLKFEVNLGGPGDHTLDVRTKLSADTTTNNDAESIAYFNNQSSINSLPHCESFETNEGGWQWRGTTQWEWGVPNGSKINSASHGTKALVTDLDGNYANNEKGYLLSPCFDLTGKDSVKVSFDLWFECEAGVDAVTLQSISREDPRWITENITLFPYTHFAFTEFGAGWSGSSGQWVRVQSMISQANKSDVMLRLYFVSNGSNVDEGIAIDNICIYQQNKLNLAYPTTCNTYEISNVKGNNVVDIIDESGNYIAYLNPNGNDLGKITVTMNDIGAPQQDSHGSFYVPRYFDISCTGGADCPTSGNFPKGDVTVGFLIEIAEILDYNSFNGSNYSMAQLYATHYDGNNENCDLSDNSGGTYTLIHKDSIVSKDYNFPLGFSLEFSTSKFSEFGFHGSSAPLNSPALPMELIDFSGRALDKINVLNWTTENEVNVQRHIIERSIDGKNWNEVKRLPAKINSKNSYQWDDNTPLLSAYYRLISQDVDGKKSISKIIHLLRSNDRNGNLQIFPQPSSITVKIKFEMAKNGIVDFVLFDVAGNDVLHENIKSEEGANQMALDLSQLPEGIYYLFVQTESHLIGIEKVIKI